MTQNQLNTMLSYPEWDMASSYAIVLVNVSLCLLYSSGMPALPFVGCIGCTLAFWHDKLQVLFDPTVVPCHEASAAQALPPMQC